MVNEYAGCLFVLGMVTPVPSDCPRPSSIDLALEEHRSRTIAKSTSDSTGRVKRCTAEPVRFEAIRIPSTKTGITGDKKEKLCRLRRLLGEFFSQTFWPSSITAPVRRSSSRTARCVTSPPYFFTRLANEAFEPVIRRRLGRPNLFVKRRSVRHASITLLVGAYEFLRISNTPVSSKRLTSARLNPVCAATRE